MEGRRLLNMDARYRDNFKVAMELRKDIKKYVKSHPRCTMDDIYRDLQCTDIPMYIAIHMLVENFELKGPDPYACGAPDGHKAKAYSIHPMEKGLQGNPEAIATR
jgi:hypothetical protein